jgi:hypothetical protein
MAACPWGRGIDGALLPNADRYNAVHMEEARVIANGARCGGAEMTGDGTGWLVTLHGDVDRPDTLAFTDSPPCAPFPDRAGSRPTARPVASHLAAELKRSYPPGCFTK